MLSNAFLNEHNRFYCAQPQIDNRTQAAINCTKDRRVSVPCYAVPGVTICDMVYNESVNESFVFDKEVPCRYVYVVMCVTVCTCLCYWSVAVLMP